MKSLKEELTDWVSEVGGREAISLLINAGLAPSTSYALVKGNYKSEPKELAVRAIRLAMSKGRAS